MDPNIKRSVVIAGHKTAVSLEAPFWREVGRLATLDGLTKSAFLSAIDGRRRGGNLSSSIRLEVLDRIVNERDQLLYSLRDRMTSPAAIAAARAELDGVQAGLMADRAIARTAE